MKAKNVKLGQRVIIRAVRKSSVDAGMVHFHVAGDGDNNSWLWLDGEQEVEVDDEG